MDSVRQKSQVGDFSVRQNCTDGNPAGNKFSFHDIEYSSYDFQTRAKFWLVATTNADKVWEDPASPWPKYPF